MKKQLLIISVLLGGLLSPWNSNAQVIGGSSQSSAVSTPRDDIFDHIHTEFKKPIPYSPLRQADVIYSKRVWQVIDFREKMNQPFYYPVKDHLQWKSFITVVLDAVKTGELTAYNAEVDDEFTTPMSIEAVESLLNGVAVNVDRKDLDGNIIGTEVAYEDRFSKTEVKSVRLKEVWYFDKQRSQLQVRILGFCPVWEYTTKDGLFKRTPLFWIYFPEARQVLAKAEVFNRKNGAERRTYDDIFWKRMFNSYVYKEDNVYDRLISDYASGMDALLESERIKTEVFEIEQYMWDY